MLTDKLWNNKFHSFQTFQKCFLMKFREAVDRNFDFTSYAITRLFSLNMKSYNIQKNNAKKLTKIKYIFK